MVGLCYFDTSYLVPLIVEEIYSAVVTEFLSKLDRQTLATSHWTLVEFASVLARGVRTGRFSREEAEGLRTRFEGMVRGSFSLILHTADDHETAAAFLVRREGGLRGPDAMHLAIAANHAVTAVFSLDKKMITEGRSLRLPVSSGIPLPGYP